MKKTIFILIFICLISLVTVGTAEIFLRVFAPQRFFFPRWEQSQEYGLTIPKNATMVHSVPGKWRFEYTTNRHGLRGQEIPISNVYTKNNVIVLGDSYSFGTGVNDGEQYAAVLGKNLGTDYDVINLSSGGWGLTQAIRKFYEFGMVYNPKTVVIQFCKNDTLDNYRDKVTVVKEGQFEFQNTTRPLKPIMRRLSKSSLLQRSHLYCFIRNNIGGLRWKKQAGKNDAVSEKQVIPEREVFYAELLSTFVHDLKDKGIDVYMIATEKDVANYAHIQETVDLLQSAKVLTFLNTHDWLKEHTKEEYASPEGHAWGTLAHRIIGERLAETIRK